MRNSKVKGFTLIELIVVIAIIGVLAAILVPSMLGYVRNARISSANSGAKQVHTACAAALTQLGVSNWKWSTGSTEGKMDFNGNNGGVIQVNWSGVSKTPTHADLDLAAYLGEDFKDYGVCFFNPGTYSVIVAGYANTSSGETALKAKAGSSTALSAVTEGTQKTDAKAGNIYGIYPAPSIGTATT